LLFTGALPALRAQSAAPGAVQTANAVPDAQVRQVILNYVDAWNRHDIPAFAALFTPAANYVNNSGTWWQSRNEISAGIGKIPPADFAKSSMTLDIQQVRFLSEHVAVAHGILEIHNVPPEAMGPRTYTMILVQQNGAWLIDDFQNTLVRKLP
jgi:uncharacterized protein (TIGR02246 family)